MMAAAEEDQKIPRHNLMLMEHLPVFVEDRHLCSPLFHVQELRRPRDRLLALRMLVRLHLISRRSLEDANLELIFVLREELRAIDRRAAADEDGIGEAGFGDGEG